LAKSGSTGAALQRTTANSVPALTMVLTAPGATASTVSRSLASVKSPLRSLRNELVSFPPASAPVLV